MKVTESKEMAIEMAKAHGVDFTKDVFEISISNKGLLHELAKSCRYKKSRTSCLSLGGAFYVHLQKIVNK